MKVLVLGSKGQLGRCLSNQFYSTDYELIYTSRQEIDIGDLEETKAEIADIDPSVVINASAYTAVDKAEEEEQAADLINHRAVANIANTCNELGCWLIHFSTDYVFDGSANRPYREIDITNPQSVYGESKLNGENAIQASGCKHLIIRTAWVFSEYGNNFMVNMLRLGAERDELSIVGDQVGCPTYAQDIAKVIVSILSRLDSTKFATGIFHYCGDQPCSWYEFAQVIFSEAKKTGLKTPSRINAIGTAEYPTPAIRPAYSVLECSKINNIFNITPSDWRHGINCVLGETHKKS
jgi:dTDP-4-dehydrorhamnose reductase